jgi:hypothetical protein
MLRSGGLWFLASLGKKKFARTHLHGKKAGHGGIPLSSQLLEIK